MVNTWVGVRRMKKYPVHLGERDRGTRLSGLGPALTIRKVWGTEKWLLYKKGWPVVIKIIEVKKPLSVQVHPPGKKGKTELWYIFRAGKRTKVLGGIELREYKVKKGDWVFLPGGTVHTIFPPALLLEVSQNNLTTYRLYDWGRRRCRLDLEKALKAVDIKAKPKIYRDINSFKCPYFQVSKKAGVFSISWIATSSKRRYSGRVYVRINFSNANRLTRPLFNSSLVNPLA